MTDTLKPCPFCGETERTFETSVLEFYGCENCSITGELEEWQNAFCWKEISRLEKELEEQSRLLGQSGSNEARLLTVIEEQKKELESQREKVKNYEKALEKIVDEKTYQTDHFFIAQEALNRHRKS